MSHQMTLKDPGSTVPTSFQLDAMDRQLNAGLGHMRSGWKG